MKNVIRLALAASCVAALAFSCQITTDIEVPEQTSNLVTLTCAFPTMVTDNGTKVSLSNTGTTQWQAGDKLIIFGKLAAEAVVHTLSSEEITDPKVAVFTEDLSGVTASQYGKYALNVAYPYDPENDPFTSSTGDDSGRARFHKTNQLLMAGYIDNSDNIVLYNLNAAILFKVSGDFDSYNFIGRNGTETVGYSNYLCQMNDDTPIYRKKYLQSNGCAGPLTKISGPVNGDGSTYNYVFLPVNNSEAAGDDATEVSLPNGFTIQFVKGGVVVKTITSTKPVTLSPGHLIDLGLLPNEYLRDFEAIPAGEKATATELSNPKSANCYIVNAGDASNKDKVFKFPTVEGNTYVYGGAAGTSVGSVVSADIVWETWNNSETVTPKSVISVVDYKDGFVYFKMPSTLHAGNALIAAKDAGGNILWSWHIWVPATSIDSGTYGLGSVTMMDRNLGALKIAEESTADPQSSGMFYQWGRKDPFRAVGSMTTNTMATTAPASIWTTLSAQVTLEVAKQNPTVMYLNAVWTSDTYTDLWASTKAINDPCPIGWKVPSNTSIFEGYWTAANYDAWNWGTYGFRAGTTGDGSTVFPYSGYPYYSSGSYDLFGTDSFTGTRLWTITAYSSPGNYRALQVKNDETRSGTGQKMSHACAIRCVAE